MSIYDAHRTGVLAHFSVQDYKDGLKQPPDDEGNLVFTVAEHKTTGTHGAATLAVNDHEAALLAGYMAFRQLPQFSDAEPYVFLTLRKTKMTQSNVSSALTAAFRNSGFSDRVNCTKLRKAAVTQVHKAHPEKRHDLASHMCHRVATAEKHYRYVEKKVNSVTCSELLRQTLSTDQSTSSSDVHRDDDTQTCVVPYQKRFLWTKENRDLVFDKFSSFVAQQRTPIAAIEHKLLSEPELARKLEKDLQLSGRALVHCVKDKVRSFFRSKYGFKKH